ncbi:MAG TPA: hypothetical protein VIJ84_02955 [Gaiellaceae bacterium]
MSLSHALRIPLAAVAMLTIAAIVVPSAAAEISGPCNATINGQNVKNQGTGAFADPITVANDAIVPVTMSAASQISHLKIQIQFAGTSWTVRDKASHGKSWSSDVKVKNYAKWGVGLYKVVGSSGGVSCTGSALVKVKGNPLTIVAGIVGLVAALMGLGGIGAAVAMTMRAGAMSFGRSLGGAVFGLIAGLGLAVLAQEYSLMYPTLGAAIGSVGLGALFGIGLVFIGKLVGSSVAIAD